MDLDAGRDMHNEVVGQEIYVAVTMNVPEDHVLPA